MGIMASTEQPLPEVTTALNFYYKDGICCVSYLEPWMRPYLLKAKDVRFQILQTEAIPFCTAAEVISYTRLPLLEEQNYVDPSKIDFGSLTLLKNVKRCMPDDCKFPDWVTVTEGDHHKYSHSEECHLRPE